MSSSTPTGTGRNPRDDRSVGAYRLGEPAPKRRAGWLIPLLALLALALVAFLLWLFLHNRDKSPKTPAAAAVATASASASAAASDAATPSAQITTPAATPSAGTGAGAGAGAGAAGSGTLLAGGATVLPATGGPIGSLSTYAGKPVTAKGVTVQSVPADEGFWIGSSTTDRVWVQLTGTAGESAYQVKKGDSIDFTGGRMVPTTAGFARSVGVTAAEGAAQLTAQRQHVSLAKSAVHLSS